MNKKNPSQESSTPGKHQERISESLNASTKILEHMKRSIEQSKKFNENASKYLSEFKKNLSEK